MNLHEYLAASIFARDYHNPNAVASAIAQADRFVEKYTAIMEARKPPSETVHRITVEELAEGDTVPSMPAVANPGAYSKSAVTEDEPTDRITFVPPIKRGPGRPRKNF